jgi:hypothetical protein
VEAQCAAGTSIHVVSTSTSGFYSDPLWIIGLIALTIASPCLAFWIFRRSMRLYESGNLIGVRM